MMNKKHLTVKQFASLCKTLPKSIHVYIHRGKVLQNSNKFIDISNPINIDFIENRTGKKVGNQNITLSENELRRLKAEKLQEDIILARLRNEKAESKLIPTELVQMAIFEVIQRYKLNYIKHTEKLIKSILIELQAGNEVINDVCSKNIVLSNEAYTRAISESKIAIKNCISESLSLYD